MRMRRHRRSRSGSRRRKDWQSNSNYEAVPGTITVGMLLLSSQWVAFPADTFGNVPGANDQIEQEEDNTIVRGFNWASVAFVPSQVASQGVVFMGVGMLMWESNDQAVPNPLTLPNPIIDADADWLWLWTAGQQMVGIPAGQQIVRSSLDSGLEPHFQSKAQRKLSSKKGLLMVACVDNSFGLSDVTRMEWAYLSRFLVLLP